MLVQLRRANSTLEMHGPSRAIQMMLTVAIARDGRVLDIAVIGSSGYPELDRSVERAMSRVTQVQPFSPDMANETVILSLGIGTKRG
ncbi:TonB family protein [Paracoccus sp. (in: a-proteobacteria)]|uniref:TonB family protein n=1 Tax=Paracoccus sp. TaxID=267 RepID=UPI00396CA86E